MKEKLRYLLRDDRPFRTRAIIAVAAGFAFSFTLIIFGVLDLYIANKQYFGFYFNEIILPVLLLGLAVTGAVCLPLLLLKGRLFDLAASLVFGFTAAAYLQGAFLNLDLGTLTGDAIEWTGYSWQPITNQLVWAGIILTVVLLRYFSRAIWQKGVVFLAVLLVGMQLAGLVASIASSNVLAEKRPAQMLSSNGIYEVSSKENILVFIVDRLDINNVASVEQEEPLFFETLDGFTYYPNTVSQYGATFPSVTSMLTSEMYFYERPQEEYFDAAWADGPLLHDLKAGGYTAKLYMEKGYTFSDIAQLEGLADNISDSNFQVSTASVLYSMGKLSLFRYLPHAWKPSFWMSGEDFSTFAYYEGAQPYITDDYAFYQNLLGQKLSVQDERSNFSFIHLNGSHPPHHLTKDAEWAGDDNFTSGTAQTMGCFRIIQEYLNQLKALGLYEDATIIISGDHGRAREKPSESLNAPFCTAFFLKSSGSAGTPLERSDVPNSHAYFSGTIAKAAGLDASGHYGPGIQDLTAEDDSVRVYYNRVIDYTMVDGVTVPHSNGSMEKYEVRGDARDFANWTMAENFEVQYPYR